MKFGITLTTSVCPVFSPQAQADYVARIAAVTEEVGFDSVWAAERTAFPADLASRYPDRFGPGKSDPRAQNVLDAPTVLSYVAGITKRVRLGFGVLILPFRNPIINAKMVTTLDALSGGRAIFGVGLGWMQEEFASVGASYADRGAVTDEHIEIFKRLCTQDIAEYRGDHFSVSGMTFFPQPVQKPHPPVFVGGNSRAAKRRAARLGDGWLPIRLTPEQVAAGRRELADLCQSYGRDSGEVKVSVTAMLRLGQEGESADGGRAPLTGSTMQVADDVRRYEEAGVDTLVLSVAGVSTGDTVDKVRSFAELVAGGAS